MDTPNEMFNRLMAYGMSRADALAVVKRAQELTHGADELSCYDQIMQDAKERMAREEAEFRYDKRLLQDYDAKMLRWRKLEAVAELACKYGIGAWEMIPSDMMANCYVLSKN